jgi:hypothetical protein
MSDDIQSNLEALSEDEGLTDNLTDAPAKAVLAWAEQQIKAGHELPDVRRAARAANRDTFDSPEAAIAAASAALGAGASAANPPAASSAATVSAAAKPPAASPAAAASPPTLTAAVESGIAAGIAQAEQAAATITAAAPDHMFKAAVTAVRELGSQALAAATARPTAPASARRSWRPKRQSRRSRFSTRRS